MVFQTEGGRMRIAVIVLLAAVAAGCATMDATRRKYVAAHPELLPEQKTAILDGELRAGMTPDMVRASWGEPFDVVQEILQGEEAETWFYQQTYGDRLNTYRVRFRRGVVYEVRLAGSHRYDNAPYRRHYWRYYP